VLEGELGALELGELCEVGTPSGIGGTVAVTPSEAGTAQPAIT
jgi:hypothetical protein